FASHDFRGIDRLHHAVAPAVGRIAHRFEQLANAREGVRRAHRAFGSAHFDPERRVVGALECAEHAGHRARLCTLDVDLHEGDLADVDPEIVDGVVETTHLD